jgi:hypothetical protein
MVLPVSGLLSRAVLLHGHLPKQSATATETGCPVQVYGQAKGATATRRGVAGVPVTRRSWAGRSSCRPD